MHLRQPLPRIWMVTDERQGDGLWRSLERLPRGGGLVFRHYGLAPDDRRALFGEVRRRSEGRRQILLLAGNPKLALAWGADGSYGSTAAKARGAGGLAAGLRSRSVHNLVELRAAERAGADLVFLSPLFATRSHPGAPPLGPLAFSAIARRARVPVIALGGMDHAKSRSLSRLHAYGWAGIDAFSR